MKSFQPKACIRLKLWFFIWSGKNSVDFDHSLGRLKQLIFASWLLLRATQITFLIHALDQIVLTITNRKKTHLHQLCVEWILGSFIIDRIPDSNTPFLLFNIFSRAEGLFIFIVNKNKISINWLLGPILGRTTGWSAITRVKHINIFDIKYWI